MNMKTFAIVLSVAFLALGLFGCGDTSAGTEEEPAAAEVVAPEVPSKTVEAAYEFIQGGTDGSVCVIDVRTPEEYDLGHIEGALNIDYYADSFRDEVAKLDKDVAYLVYCRCGTRGAFSTEIMQELGFSEVYNMEEGFLEWQFQQLPSVK